MELLDTMETTTSLFSYYDGENTTDLTTTLFTQIMTSSSPPPPPTPPEAIVYCGPGWTSFWASIAFLVIPLRVFLCVVGIVTNILNILVFTRRPMRNPTNTILTALCAVDLICLLRLGEYLTVTTLTPLGQAPLVSTFPMAIHALASDILVQLFHAWSVYLTLALAFWRLLGVAQPLRSRSWCTQKGARYFILIALSIGVILMLPMYWHATVAVTSQENGTGIPQYGMVMDPVWYWHQYLTVHIIFIKVAPCIVLTIVTATLVVYLLRAKRNRTKLFKSGGTVRKPASSDADVGASTPKTEELPQSAKQKLEYDRTTKMLLVILIVFLITEFPFAIINTLNTILGNEFGVQCKNPPLRFLSSAEYMSSAISFFCYFVMSKNFRHHFFELIRIKSQLHPSTQRTKSGGLTSTSYGNSQTVSTTTGDSHV